MRTTSAAARSLNPPVKSIPPREIAYLLDIFRSVKTIQSYVGGQTHEEFLAVTLEPEAEYAVNVVNAPVFDHTGHVTLVLSLTGFGRPLRGRDVQTAGARLVDATTKLTAALNPRPSEGGG